jgi:hypothetical protein
MPEVLPSCPEVTIKKKKVIVIGDWFIDENWLVSKQHLFESTETGDIHFRARHGHLDRRNVCPSGAAGVIEILRGHFSPIESEQSSQNGSIEYEFVGFGTWHPADNEVIQCVLCDRHAQEKLLTPNTLLGLRYADKTNGQSNEGERPCLYDRSQTCVRKKGLYNLAKEGDADRFTTHRIVRCYEAVGGGTPHLLYRIDWQQDVPANSMNPEIIPQTLDESAGDVAAVVVEDHGKGVMTPDVVRTLIRVIPESAMWFIRSKMEHPSWVGVLQEAKRFPELVVTDFKLAEHKKAERSWWRGTEPSRAALELLGEMTGARTYQDLKKVEPDKWMAKSVAVLLDSNQVIGKAGDEVFCITQPPGPRQPLNIGRTTVFYAALIAQRLERPLESSVSFRDECNGALRCAWKWSENVSAGWENGFAGNHWKALEGLLPEGDAAAKAWSYEKSWEHWNDASQKHGIVNLGDTRTRREVIQLWRGEGMLSGYTCVGGPKRNAINRLAGLLAEFVRDKSPADPFSCLLISAPGWGKSTLARSLARHFGLDYMEFSLAQMTTTDELVESLTQIASRQATDPRRKLVFMDELNAEIGGHSAMGLLLSPLGDGTFSGHGHSYRLIPAAWVFASTARFDKLVIDDKGSDFVSRIFGPILDLDSLGSKNLVPAIEEVKKILNRIATDDLAKYQSEIYGCREYDQFCASKDDALKTEQVYLMLNLIVRHWGPINLVQKPVIELFHDVLPVNGIRSLDFFSRAFKGVKQGKIVAPNVPTFADDPELRRHIVAPAMWLQGNGSLRESMNDVDTVEIETATR